MIWIWFLLALVFNIAVGYFVSHQRANDGKIQDIGFEVLPDLSRYEHLPDMLLAVPVIFLALSWKSWSPSKRVMYLKFLTLMFFFRGITNAVTTFPYSKGGECKLRIPFGYCKDYMFSGHTTFNVVTSSFVGAPLWPVFPAFTSLASVATRDHYTVDIVVAWLLFFAIKCRLK